MTRQTYLIKKEDILSYLSYLYLSYLIRVSAV